MLDGIYFKAAFKVSQLCTTVHSFDLWVLLQDKASTD